MLAAVFVAVSHWMHRAAKKPKAAACMDATAHQLAKCVRYPMLSNDFLHFVVSQVCYCLGSASLRTALPQLLPAWTCDNRVVAQSSCFSHRHDVVVDVNTFHCML